MAPFLRPEVGSELERLAARYVWWNSPAIAVRRPERVVAQVMGK